MFHFSVVLSTRTIKNNAIMSVQLMNECKKKLGNVLGKFDKLNEIYNSEVLERVLYETVKLESAVKETHESTAKITFEYQSNAQRLREIVEQGFKRLDDE